VRRSPARVGTTLGIAAVAACLVTPVVAHAHTTLPAYLELNELTAGAFDLAWKVPAVEGPPPPIYPEFPRHCALAAPLSETQAAGSILMRGVLQCGAEGLAGQSIEIAGLRTTIMETVVRLAFLDGTSAMRVLRPSEPSFVVTQAAPGADSVDARGHFRLGVDHILSGIDHLLFVFGLLLLVRGTGRLLKAITSFTVAHSITLGLAALGVVRLAPAPIEAVIALSIVFLAVEVAQERRGVAGLSQRKPWLVAFAFGLLHGFGFAGTLSQIGLPAGDIPMALLYFNVGVEAGQVGFIVVCLAVMASLRTLDLRPPAWAHAVPAYVIGPLASYWFLERCVSAFTS